MITHKSASAANLSIKVRRYQTFEVCETSKVYNRCGFSKIWVITARLMRCASRLSAFERSVHVDIALRPGVAGGKTSEAVDRSGIGADVDDRQIKISHNSIIVGAGGKNNKNEGHT
jgi:hypothetical protein